MLWHTFSPVQYVCHTVCVALWQWKGPFKAELLSVMLDWVHILDWKVVHWGSSCHTAMMKFRSILTTNQK